MTAPVVPLEDSMRTEEQRAKILAEAQRAIHDLTATRGAPHPSMVAERLRERFTTIAAAATPPPEPRRGVSTADVICGWLAEGPLVHEPTGLEALDHATGGGPVYGSRWYVQGAPDAGKTGLVLQIAHTYAERGIAVGLLAVDEDPSDVVTRLCQRIGFERVACERREPGALDSMGNRIGDLPIRFYDASWTIEEAAADLAAYAREREPEARHPRAVLGIDSVQTVQCNAERSAERELSTVQAIEARVRAIRSVASRYRLIAIATSEMGRAGYRNKRSADNADPLAAAKWSGAIEYSARVLLSLTNVSGTPDTICLELPKNKHGRRLVASEGEGLYLRINRPWQSFTETAPPAAPEQSEDDETRVARADEKVDAMAERILGALAKANARGVEITSRADLAALVSGGNDIKAKAVSRLITEGRIEGGRGRPFAPRYPESETEQETSPDRSGPVPAPTTDRSSSVPLRGGGRRTGSEGAGEGGAKEAHPPSCACGDCRDRARARARRRAEGDHADFIDP